MAICKFFQQGNCRYGQSCRFDHIYGSKYSYHPNAGQQQPANNSVTDEQLIHADIQAALKGGQWLLSCYAPFKEKPCFPGLTDLSPEEARLFIYEAQSNNNLEQAIPYINNLFKDARSKYEQLLMKNPNITRIFRCLYNGEPVVSPFSNGSQDSFSNNASSVFHSGIQTPPYGTNTPSIFSQSNTPFGQNTQAFQTSNPDPAKSIFAQASQNAFNNQSAVFAPQPDTTAKSLFAQASQSVFAPTAQNPSNLFANASQSLMEQQQTHFVQKQEPLFGHRQDPLFGQNQPLFGQNQQAAFGQEQKSLFEHSQATNVVPESDSKKSIFGTGPNIFQQSLVVDATIYSKMEDLSSDAIAAFQSEEFKLGFVPELPPPQILCF